MTEVVGVPADDFRVTMLLCDHVEVAEGKLFINGGGWWWITGQPMPFGVALLIGVPWGEANRQIHFDLRLVKEDGDPVNVHGPMGEVPLQIGGDFEVGRPPGSTHGAHLSVPLAVNLPPIGLPPGERLCWVLELDGRLDASWRLPFEVRPVE